MRAAIELATDETPGPDAPEFYAFTHFDNTSSQNVLARLQFEGQAWDRVLGLGGGTNHRYTLPSGKQLLHPQQLWRRPSNPPLSPLPADVYVGPVQT